jgi:3-hydroxymyristoyl/3-hydroxydecanoyl-(acyl carrier protein) dehydratase
MLITEDEILDLLPQRPPMVMIDRLVSCDEKRVVSRLTINQDNIFVANNCFTAPGIIEAIAQTAAARTGYLLKNKPGGINKRPPVGVIGSIKNFKLSLFPETGSTIITTVDIEHEVMQATVVKGKIEVDGKIAAECILQIFLTGNP